MLSGDRVDVAQSTEQEYAARGELAGDELQQKERRRVGGVEIVQHEQDRPARGSRAQKLRDSVEQPKARSLRIKRRRLGDAARKELAQLRKDLRDVRGARTELCAQRLRLRLADVAAKRLHPGPVGGSAARLPAATDEHAHPARARTTDQLLGEAALADPRLADEQEEAAMPGQRILEPREQCTQLSLAADEGAPCPLLRRPGLHRELERRILAEDRLLQLP